QDHHGQKLEKVTIDVVRHIHQLLQERSPVLETRQLHIEMNISPDITVQAEPFWFNQALGNILDNAFDFTPRGGCMTIQCSTLANEIDNKKIGTMIQVENEGEAIPDYALPQIFDRYFSLPRPDSGRKSTGIGLTLVREVMALHQGQVTVENVEGGVRVSLLF
ncbi:MAG TPA: ATP-binding protein, partial [Aquirhabdus sp.]